MSSNNQSSLHFSVSLSRTATITTTTNPTRHLSTQNTPNDPPPSKPRKLDRRQSSKSQASTQQPNQPINSNISTTSWALGAVLTGALIWCGYYSRTAQLQSLGVARLRAKKETELWERRGQLKALKEG